MSYSSHPYASLTTKCFVFKVLFLCIYLALPVPGLHCPAGAALCCGARASHRGGLVAARRPWGLGPQWSQPPAARAQGMLLRSTWGLPGGGVKLGASALAGRFCTAEEAPEKCSRA